MIAQQVVNSLDGSHWGVIVTSVIGPLAVGGVMSFFVSKRTVETKVTQLDAELQAQRRENEIQFDAVGRELSSIRHTSETILSHLLGHRHDKT